MNSVLLLLGGNQGDSIQTIETATNLIEETVGELKKKSSFYQTAAWGKINQPDFINQAIEIRTNLNPQDLLTAILAIEKKMGRLRNGVKWEERIIDIDILFYESKIIDEENLTIPHPFLQDRKFVLVPLAEIAGELTHPQLNKTIYELLHVCNDLLIVKKIKKYRTK